jgi:uracil-DNA glycosylase
MHRQPRRRSPGRVALTVRDAALERVGLARDGIFVTNAVEHCKFAQRGKRCLHQKPSSAETDVRQWWLGLEREFGCPRLVVAMGTSAARGVFGRPVSIARTRGEVLPLEPAAHALVTVHSSYLLRIDDEAKKRKGWNGFLGDLAVARDCLDAPEDRVRDG